MKTVHTLKAVQVAPVSVDSAWDFFSRPENLAEITPDQLGFQITSDVPEEMYQGMIISYTVKPMFSVPVTWVTEITRVVDKRMFVDEQRKGPYSIWHHEHHFDPVDGGTRFTDKITYSLPLEPLTSPVEKFVVRKQLTEIFSYRSRFITERFGEPQDGSSPTLEFL